MTQGWFGAFPLYYIEARILEKRRNLHNKLGFLLVHYRTLPEVFPQLPVSGRFTGYVTHKTTQKRLTTSSF